jgi:hypothetical protein
MPVKLTPELLKQYFMGQAKHRAYTETVAIYNRMKTHANGEMPTDLIHDRRPSESEETMVYRKKIYVPKTKNPIGKVISSLSKIRRSPDWSIQWDKEKVPSSIIPGERLEDYCEENYPGHDSLTNWIFSVLLRTQCIDANAIVAVLPTNPNAGTQNEYYKPIAYVFNSDQVLFYEEGAEYAILQSSERSSLVSVDANGNLPNAGLVFYVITTALYQKWEMDSKADFQLTQQLVHKKGKLPVFKVRAQFLQQKENTIIQESRLSLMLADLDEAAREYSDLQASKVQHMYPLFWYYQSKSCNHCTGTGKIINNESVSNCTHCEGSGKIKFSPYVHMAVEPPKIGEHAFAPTPPAGYVSRDVEIIKHQEDSVKSHLFDALASINMQFLDQTPLNISGDAKNVDREELNNFVYSIAEDLVYTMDKIYWWINEWRYGLVVPGDEDRKAMLPEIPVPEQFDLLPADYLMDGVSKARTAKINPILLSALEQDYAMKKFYSDPKLSALIQNYFELDPLPGLTVDEKMSLLTNKGITQEQYVISANIVGFVRRAIDEDPQFFGKKLGERYKIIEGFASEIVTATDEADQLKQELLLEQQQAMSNDSSLEEPSVGGGKPMFGK